MPCVHSQTSRGPSFGPKLPNSGRVPPLPFFPTSAAYSARHPAGLLHPASGHGVRQVSGSLPALCPKTRVGGSPSPVALYPSEFSPPRQAGARHRTPVPSRRCSEPLAVGPPVLPRLAPRPSARHSTSGHCSAAKSVASLPAFPLTNCPILPWAWSQAGSDAFPSPLRGAAGGCPCGPGGPLRTGQGFGRFIAPPKRVESASDAWPDGPWPRRASVRCVRRDGGPRGVRPCRRLACHPGVAALSTPRFAEPEGFGAPRVGRVGGHPRAPSGRRRRYLRGGTPLPSLPLPVAFAVWSPARGSVTSGCRWLQFPIGSVAAVRGSRRSLSPWFGARWVRCRGSGLPKEPFPVVRGPLGPSRGSGRPKASVPVVGPVDPSAWVWARWIRRAVRGSRRSLSPWSGPGGSVALARGPGGSCCRGSGAHRPSRGSGRPKASVPVVGAMDPSAASWAR
jgi:hypothetical protein